MQKIYLFGLIGVLCFTLVGCAGGGREIISAQSTQLSVSDFELVQVAIRDKLILPLSAIFGEYNAYIVTLKNKDGTTTKEKVVCGYVNAEGDFGYVGDQAYMAVGLPRAENEEPNAIWTGVLGSFGTSPCKVISGLVP